MFCGLRTIIQKRRVGVSKNKALQGGEGCVFQVPSPLIGIAISKSYSENLFAKVFALEETTQCLRGVFKAFLYVDFKAKLATC